MGRCDSIHCRTSCSHQHKRRECGILKCGGIKCVYFLLVAHVRIVFVVFPISSESCSTKRMRCDLPSAVAWEILVICHHSLDVSGLAAEHRAMHTRHFETQ